MKLTIQEMQELGTEMLKEVHIICEQNDIEYFLAYGSVLGAVRHQGPIPWDYDTDIYIPFPELDRFIKIARKELPSKFYLDFYDTNKKFRGLFPRIGLKGRSTTNLHLDVFFLSGTPSKVTKHSIFYKRALWLHKLYLRKKPRVFPPISFKGKLLHIAYKIALFPISEKFFFRKFFKLSAQYPYETSEYVMNPNGYYGVKEVFPKSFLGKGKLHSYGDLQIRVPEKHNEYLSHFYGDYMTPPPENLRRIREYYIIGAAD